MKTNYRIPGDSEEAYAMGFMVGYLGEFPDALKEVIDLITEGDADPSYTPDIFPDDDDGLLARDYRRGYDTGVAFFCDHGVDEDTEEVSA